MIQAWVGDIHIVGLTRKNIERLTSGEPIRVINLRPSAGTYIVFGETKPAIIAQLERETGVKFEQAHKDAAAEDPE